MVIIPAIMPINAPKTMSFIRLRLKLNEPSKIENTINAKIVNKTPIMPPKSQPFVLIFLPKTKQPIKIETALITWFIGWMALFCIPVYFIINAKIKIASREKAKAQKVPLISCRKVPDLVLIDIVLLNDDTSLMCFYYNYEGKKQFMQKRVY